MNKTVKTGLILGVVAGLGFFLYNYLRNKRLEPAQPTPQPTDTAVNTPDKNIDEMINTGESQLDLETPLDLPVFLDDSLVIKPSIRPTTSTTSTTTSSSTVNPFRTPTGGGGGYTGLEADRLRQQQELSKSLAQHYIQLQQSQVPFYNTSQQISSAYSNLGTKQTTLSASY